jgi:hypothetical protein
MISSYVVIQAVMWELPHSQGAQVATHTCKCNPVRCKKLC